MKKQISSELKGKVALEAIRSLRSINDIASKYGVYLTHSYYYIISKTKSTKETMPRKWLSLFCDIGWGFILYGVCDFIFLIG